MHRVPPGTEDVHRVVDGNEDHLRICRGDGDDLGRWWRRIDDDGLRRRWRGLNGDNLLFIGTQVAGILRLGSEKLHGIHDGLGLCQESIAKVVNPFRLLAQHGEHLRESDQRLHTGIPWLVLNRLDRRVTLQIVVGECPVGCLHDVRRIGGGHQHLRE
jgi:hypothetical protein